MNLIDEFFLEANPNPERIGCPPEETIRLISSGKVPANHAARAHLATCSECYAEFQSFRLEASGASQAENTPWVVGAGVLSGSEASLRSRSAPGGSPAPAPMMPPQEDIALDFGMPPVGAKRIQPTLKRNVLDLSSGTERELTLPIGLLDIHLLLPSTQALGAYRLFFSQAATNPKAEFATAGVLVKEDDQMILRALTDLRQFSRGAASLTLVAAVPERSEVYALLLVDEG